MNADLNQRFRSAHEALVLLPATDKPLSLQFEGVANYDAQADQLKCWVTTGRNQQDHNLQLEY